MATIPKMLSLAFDPAMTGTYALARRTPIEAELRRTPITPSRL
jgi:hypothetical protein